MAGAFLSSAAQRQFGLVAGDGAVFGTILGQEALGVCEVFSLFIHDCLSMTGTVYNFFQRHRRGGQWSKSSKGTYTDFQCWGW